MSRGPQTFRQRDLCAAIKAARAAGVEVARVEIKKDGTMTVIIGKPEPAGSAKNEWDDLLK